MAEPGDMSLLGLVRHLADGERGWFRRRMARLDAPPLFRSADDPDGDLDGAVPDPARPRRPVAVGPGLPSTCRAPAGISTRAEALGTTV